MSLLDDSATAVRLRDRILSELKPAERVLFVTDGNAMAGPDYGGHAGAALIVTDARMLIVEAKPLGRAVLVSIWWRDVTEISDHQLGGIGLHTPIRPFSWRFEIFPPGAKKYSRGPLDESRMRLLARSINEALAAEHERKSVETKERQFEAATAYEELKRRRGE